MSDVTGTEVGLMIDHWISTPPNGYLGSDYGTDLKALLQRPNSDGLADQFIDKLVVDVPVVGALPANMVNVYFDQSDKETKYLRIETAGSIVTVDSTRFLD